MHKLVQELTLQDGAPPWGALQQCMEQIEAVTPDLLGLAERAANGSLDSQEEREQALLALHLLAWARDQRLFPILLQLLRRPSEELEEVLHDAISETLARILISSFGGPPEALFDLARDEQAYVFARASAFVAIAFLTWEGRIDPAATRGFLVQLDDARRFPPGDYTWRAWSEAIELLGWQDLARRVERAYADRRIPNSFSSVGMFRDALAQSRAAAPADNTRFEKDDIGYFHDLLAQLRWIDLNAERVEEVQDEEEEDPVPTYLATLHPLVRGLTLDDGVPWAQIKACQQQIDAVAADLLDMVERVADAPPDEVGQDIAFLAIHILAAARDKRLYPPLVRLLAQYYADDVLGDASIYTLQKVIVSCFDGDAAPLFELVRFADIESYVRSSALRALAFLTWQGSVDAAAMRACLEQFDDDPPIQDEDEGWLGWAEAIELLGWKDLAPRVEVAMVTRPDMDMLMPLDEFRSNLAASQASEPGDASRFEAQGLGYLGELAIELAWLDEPDTDEMPADADEDSPFGLGPPPSLLDPPDNFTQQQRSAYLSGEPVRNPLRNVGRNDPCPCGSGKKFKRCCGAAA